jgi:hypothetical protein
MPRRAASHARRPFCWELLLLLLLLAPVHLLHIGKAVRGAEHAGTMHRVMLLLHLLLAAPVLLLLLLCGQRSLLLVLVLLPRIRRNW